ncbi:5-nitroimidazole antibiotic resistance protein [Prevotella sp. oral taxon 376]|uniref:pyridoxamine 5'-phosphate oxidase family protein n=1 Tax=Prevotella sp. oral taxon 376 TaxID=712466 RepID=UPI000D1DC7ED|nr:pyridoxamine 5'-phosphate oxidase family protein [Prevotella sp. oral taxon 376]PTL32868.1 5-nitroimidazole antibiotic resistance protein [Prevotella sp. oral taxon 376]
MIYDNSEVRRQDRLLDEKRAMELLKNNEYGFLSMISEVNEPYGIPVNYVWDGRESIYIHCAPEGKKLRALRKSPKVSFCLIGNVRLMPGMFTTEYESVIFEGTAHLDLPDYEKMDALHLMIDKLSADFKELGDKYAHKSFHRVEIIRINLMKFSGKRKHVRATRPNY